MANNKREFLIIFTDVHLSYSPTTLNIFNELKKEYSVEIIAPKPEEIFSKHELSDPGIKYFSYNYRAGIFEALKTLYYKFSDKLIKPSAEDTSRRRLKNYKTRTIISLIKNTKKEIIAVDFLALWCVQQVNRKAHLLSLEIIPDDIYYKNINNAVIKSVIIQSEERLNYLFKENKPPHFIVQNAPKKIDFKPEYHKRKHTDIIYCGSAVSRFGVISCLDFIKDYKEYTLTIKGAVPPEVKQAIDEFYSDLLEEKRLILANEYLSDAELTYFVSTFRIGFAFYDFYRFPELRTFNYFTAPSGKVFQYLNSGVPIIGNELPGFQFIADENCGKLISYISSQQIKSAIDIIEKDYHTYAANAKAQSIKNDFDIMVQPFIKYIANNSN